MRIHSVQIEGQKIKVQITPNRHFITIDLKQDRLILHVSNIYDIKATQHGNQVLAVMVSKTN